MGDCTDYDFNVPKKGAMTLKYTGTIGDLVQRAAGFVDRPLVDETGLSGKFEWNVSFWLDPLSPEGPSIYERSNRSSVCNWSDDAGPSTFT